MKCFVHLQSIMASVKAQARIVASTPEVGRLRSAAAFLDEQVNKHRRLVAVTFSLLLHVAFVLTLLIDLRSGLSARGFDGAGDNDGSGMAVEMLSDYDLQQAILNSKVVREDTPEDEVTPLDVPQLDPVTDALKPALADAFSSELKPPPSLSASQGDTGGNGSNGADDDALWQAIAPCWRDMADANTLPVTLEISFDEHGGIASPPRIDRDPTLASDSRSRRSEVMAMQALAACGNYAMAEGRTGVKVTFPVP